MSVVFRIELEQETDGRWIAEVVELPGVLAHGATQDEAVAHVQALALRVVADRLEKDAPGSEFLNITFAAALAERPAELPPPLELAFPLTQDWLEQAIAEGRE